MRSNWCDQWKEKGGEEETERRARDLATDVKEGEENVDKRGKSRRRSVVENKNSDCVLGLSLLLFCQGEPAIIKSREHVCCVTVFVWWCCFPKFSQRRTQPSQNQNCCLIIFFFLKRFDNLFYTVVRCIFAVRSAFKCSESQQPGGVGEDKLFWLWERMQKYTYLCIYTFEAKTSADAT